MAGNNFVHLEAYGSRSKMGLNHGMPVSGSGGSTTAPRRQWRQCTSATSAEAWRHYSGGSSISGGGCSVKRGGGEQRDGGSAVAAAWMLRRWCQRDSATLTVAWRRSGGGGGSAKRGGGAQRDGGSAEAAAVAAARQRDVGGNMVAARRQRTA